MTLAKNGGAIKMIVATNSLEAHNTNANNSYPRFGSNGQNSNSVSMSYYVLYEDGDLFSLGDNKWRQLGDWTTTERRSWVQPRYNSSSGPVMNDIAWISPQEHDYVWSFINVVNNDNKLINWGSESGNDLGRTVGSQGTGLEVHTDWNPGSPHKMDPDAVVITAESGGHTSVFIQECETDFGYIGHKINGSMGDGTTDGSTDDNVHLATAAIQICGAPSQLGDLNVSVTHEGGTYCMDEVVTMIGTPSGGTFSIEEGSDIASIDGQSGELAFSGEGIVKVKYVIDLTEETCGEETHYYSLIVEECLPVVFDVSGTVYVDNDGVLNGVGGDPLGNVTVHLKDENDNIVATTTTDSNGDYEFTEVENGNYTIEIENPGEYLYVSDTQGDADDGKIEITVSGADHTGNDFGLNQKPVGQNVEDTYVQNEPKEIDLSEEISDPDGNEDVSTIGFEVPSGATCEETDSDGRCIKVEVPGEGTWEVEEDGKVTFAPDEDYVGDAEIDYTVLDEAGLESDPKTIELKADVEPSISLVKSGVLSADGTSIEYTFTVTNTGNVTLTNVVIDDAKLGISGQLINPSTLAPDQEGTYTTTYMVTQADLDAGVVENTATTTGTPPVGDNVTAGDDENIPLGQDPSISLLKEGVLDGEEIIYTFTVQNTGNVTLTDVVVNDVMLSNDPIAVNPSTLIPGATGTASATYTVTQADLDAGIVENTATATGKDPEDNDVTDEDDEEGALERDPSIHLLKGGVYVDADNNEIVNPGDEIHYTFTVTNTGNVTLTDVVIHDDRIGVEDLFVTDELAPAAEMTVAFTYTITQNDINDGGVWNLAIVTGNDPDDEPVEDESEDPEPLEEDDPDYDPECPDCTFVPLEESPSIHLLKSGFYVDANGDGIVNPGDEIHYTFTVTNTGNVPLTDVTVTDPLVTVSGGPIDLDVGESNSTEFKGVYTVTQADINAGGVYNIATTTGTPPIGDPVEDDSEDPEPLDPEDPNYDEECPDCTFVPLEESPSIHLLKSGIYVDGNGDDILIPCDEIHYTLFVPKTGKVPLTGVTVTDPLVTVSGGPIGLDMGQSDETTFTGVYVVTQADINAGGVYNIATTTGTPPKGDPVEDDSEDPNPLDEDDPNYDPDCPDCTFVPLEESPSIHLLKSGVYVDANGDDIVNPGDEIHYTFVVTNTGNVPLTGVTVTDPLVTVSGGPIGLDVGQSDETTFTGVYVITQEDINAGGVYNIATTTGTPPKGDPVEDDSEDPEPLDPEDPNYDPDCPDCTFVPLEESPSIHLLKSGVYVDANGDDIVNPGDEIHYTFVVTNTGNVPLTDVTVTDPLVTVSGGPIDLDVGESDEETFTGVYVVTQADINAGGVYNIATTTGTPPKGDPVEDDSEDPEPLDPEDPNFDPECPDCTFVPLEESPSIHLLKSGVYVDANDDDIVNPGDEIHYTFTVTNTGNVPLTDVTVTDPLVTVTGGPIDLDVGENDETTFTGVYVVTQADINAGGVYNIALVTGTSPDGEEVEDESEDPEPLDPDDPDYDPECPDCTFVPLEESPSIHLLKSGAYVDANEDGIVNPGDEIHYTFVVTNTGNVPLTDVTVTDPLVTVTGGPIDLDVGESDETTFTGVYVVTQADINAGGVYNIATTTATPRNGDPVEDDSADPNPLEEDDPAYDPECADCTFVPLEVSASIHLLKSGAYVDANEDGIVNPGDEIHYTFVVTNTGNVPLTDVTVTDPLVTVSGGPIDLEVGESEEETFTGEI